MTNRLDYLKQMTACIGEVIHAAGEIPTGHIYAHTMQRLSLDEFNTIIATLKSNGMITVSGLHVAKSTPKLAEFFATLNKATPEIKPEIKPETTPETTPKTEVKITKNAEQYIAKIAAASKGFIDYCQVTGGRLYAVLSKDGHEVTLACSSTMACGYYDTKPLSVGIVKSREKVSDDALWSPFVGKGVCTTIPTNLFERLTPHTSTEATRFFFNGIYIDTKNNTMVATDGNTMGIENFSFTEGTPSYIVPSLLVKTVLTIAKKAKATHVEYYAKEDKSTVTFAIGDIAIAGERIDATYPDYKKIIPEDGEDFGVFDQGAFHGWYVSAAKQARILQGLRSNKPICVKVIDGRMQVHDDVATLACPLSNNVLPTWPFGFNGDYLLKLPQDTQLRMVWNSSRVSPKPTKFVHATGMYLVMPMRLS